MGLDDAVKLSDSLQKWDPMKLLSAGVLIIALSSVGFMGWMVKASGDRDEALRTEVRGIRDDHRAQRNAMNLLAVVADYNACMYFAGTVAARVDACYANYRAARESWAKEAFEK